MKLRLDPADEYTHPLEEATNFNESMYFNLFDPDGMVGGFFRLGNRANEGYAEMTTCLFLPDGRAAFMFKRPEISDNETFDAGGLRFQVLEPFERLQVAYEGKVVVLDDPLAMADPKGAFTDNPWVDCVAEITFDGVSPMLGGEPVGDDGNSLTEDVGQGFARAHYEQHVAGIGRIQVGNEHFEIRGYGLRDHSWGPRFWQSPWWYRWLTGNAGADSGFVVSVIASRDGSRRTGGVLLHDGAYEPIRGVELTTEWSGSESYHSVIHATVSTEDRRLEIEGSVRTLVPLRNRRRDPDGDELLTRISEGLTEWRFADRVGYGLSEYLDQIVEGQPAGLTG